MPKPARMPERGEVGEDTPLRPPRAPAVRFRVDPIFAPAEKIARMLGLTEAQFTECRRRLYGRGFPTPDETTGHYHIEAVERWAKRRRPDLFAELTFSTPAAESAPPRKSMGERFVEASERRRHG